MHPLDVDDLAHTASRSVAWRSRWTQVELLGRAADRFLARPPLELGSWDEEKREIQDSLARGLRS